MQKQWDESPAIGIDLGTTYSVVGIWMPTQNRVEIIVNDLGNRLTPSVVAFIQPNPRLVGKAAKNRTFGDNRLVGEAAKNQAFRNPLNTIFESKRLIGRRYADSSVQEDVKLWPFKAVPGKDDSPMIEVTEDGQKRQFIVHEISSMILGKMKRIAEAKLGKKIKNAVITVPAYFSVSQRQATKEAGEIAGLNVLRIICEPTAAALAYSLHNKFIDAKKNILVFDLGGGTFDVALVTIGKDSFDVKGVTGDTHLGGGDFDSRMVNHFAVEFKKIHSIDIGGNHKALGRLRDTCENAKKTLSSYMEAPIEIDCLSDGIDFFSTISRAQFERMNMDLFQKCLEMVEQCLKDANMEKSDIDDVLLVGGSTRIPKIQSMLKALFNGKELSNCVNPDEAVAHGAAFQAAILSGVNKFNNNDVVISDVTPLSLGIEWYNTREMKVVIPRNTTYPIRKRHKMETSVDNQTRVSFEVYEGEKPKYEDNYFLGGFILSDIPPGPQGKEKFDVFFDIDSDGILTVSAQHRGTENKNQITINNNKWGLDKKEKDRMTMEAMQHTTTMEKNQSC